jgi:AcrR family transcriptional regulator
MTPEVDDNGPASEQRKDFCVILGDARHARYENDRGATVVTAGVEIVNPGAAVFDETRMRHGQRHSMRRQALAPQGPPANLSKSLNQSLDLIVVTGFTDPVTTASRPVRTERASITREAILAAAERLFAEHGVYAVSNRQVSEAAGQGNNAAVGYHFGTKADLVRAIEQKHRVPIERLLARMVTDTADSTELRDWIACMVCSLTEHLDQLGNPTWYARFAAQALADPAYQKIVVKDALASPSLLRVVEGITRCLPDLPMTVVTERNIMVRNLMMHTCADFERAFAEGAQGSHISSMPRTTWSSVASGLIDAIVGLWQAPITERP